MFLKAMYDGFLKGRLKDPLAHQLLDATSEDQSRTGSLDVKRT
jgi:hypothetical protein